MADYSNGYISAAYGLEATAQLGTAYMQSEALRAQGQFQQTIAEINQQFANRRADQVEIQGNMQANRIHRQGLQVQGAQRASAAAQGIRVDDGSAADAVDQSRYMSADDQITARNNAWREAFGIRTQAKFAMNQAQMQNRANQNTANATLLGGAMQSFATGMKATSFGLKAYRDLNPVDTNTYNEDGSVVSTVKSRKATDYENEYFDSIFADSPDQRNA